jgi:hypothetical protein
MAQRVSGYVRRELEFYPTPFWVVHALAEHIDLKGKGIWEPACGTGEMCDAILAAGAANVYATDIKDYGYRGFSGELDFVSGQSPAITHYDGILTNPPYGERGKLAELFIEHGLRRISDYGFLALLLPSDFDAASTRAKYFRDCPIFAGQVTLTKRIKWFDEDIPCKKCDGTGKILEIKCKTCKGTGMTRPGPSNNHAWFVWQRTWIGGSQTQRKMYAPRVAEKVAA